MYQCEEAHAQILLLCQYFCANISSSLVLLLHHQSPRCRRLQLISVEVRSCKVLHTVPAVAQDPKMNRLPKILEPIKDELTRLTTENEALKRQVQDYDDLKGKYRKLKAWYQFECRITSGLKDLAMKHRRAGTPTASFLYWYAGTHDSQYKEGCDQKWCDQKWFDWADKKLVVAEKASEEKWKEKIALLESKVEQQQHDMQASTATANATIANLKRKNEELQEQIHEKEVSEKHCHQVLNHLENFIEAHPGEAGKFKNLAVCARTDQAAVKKAVEWFQWADDKIRIAKDLDEVTSRSAKRRKIRTELSIDDHDQHGYHEPATTRAIASATENVHTPSKTVSDQFHMSLKQAKAPNSAATRSPLVRPGRVLYSMNKSFSRSLRSVGGPEVTGVQKSHLEVFASLKPLFLEGTPGRACFRRMKDTSNSR